LVQLLWFSEVITLRYLHIRVLTISISPWSRDLHITPTSGLHSLTQVPRTHSGTLFFGKGKAHRAFTRFFPSRHFFTYLYGSLFPGFHRNRRQQKERTHRAKFPGGNLIFPTFHYPTVIHSNTKGDPRRDPPHSGLFLWVPIQKAPDKPDPTKHHWFATHNKNQDGPTFTLFHTQFNFFTKPYPPSWASHKFVLNPN